MSKKQIRKIEKMQQIRGRLIAVKNQLQSGLCSATTEDQKQGLTEQAWDLIKDCEREIANITLEINIMVVSRV